MKIKRETIVAGSIISRRIYGGIKRLGRKKKPKIKTDAGICGGDQPEKFRAGINDKTAS